MVGIIQCGSDTVKRDAGSQNGSDVAAPSAENDKVRIGGETDMAIA